MSLLHCTRQLTIRNVSNVQTNVVTKKAAILRQCTSPCALGRFTSQIRNTRRSVRLFGNTISASDNNGTSDSSSSRQSAALNTANLSAASSSPHEIASTASETGEQGQDSSRIDVENQAIAEVQQALDVEALEAAAASQKRPNNATVAVPEPTSDPSMVDIAKVLVNSNPVLKFFVYGTAGFLGLTFVIALVRVGLKNVSPQAKRKKTVNKNKAVIDALSQYLPANRAGLNASAMRGLRRRTGFKPVEIFRKYLWYLLRERKFDQEAVDDVFALKAALGLTDEQVAEALKERAQRIYEKYGNVMLDTEGMSPAGIERKATSRALFSKLLFLTESEQLLSPEAAKAVDLRDVFGATEDDASRLRIASLYDVDLETAMGLPDAPESEGEAEPSEE